MSYTVNRFNSKLSSFIGMGIFLVLLVIGIIFFSYLLLVGAIIGLVLFAIAYIRAKFFLRKANFQTKHAKKNQQASGRVIEHDEIN